MRLDILYSTPPKINQKEEDYYYFNSYEELCGNIKSVLYYYYQDSYIVARNELYEAFTWADTRQGDKFWLEVSNDLENDENTQKVKKAMEILEMFLTEDIILSREDVI